MKHQPLNQTRQPLGIDQSILYKSLFRINQTFFTEYCQQYDLFILPINCSTMTAINIQLEKVRTCHILIVYNVSSFYVKRFVHVKTIHTHKVRVVNIHIKFEFFAYVLAAFTLHVRFVNGTTEVSALKHDFHTLKICVRKQCFKALTQPFQFYSRYTNQLID